LLVEDDAQMRGLTLAILRGAGYTVLEAQSGGDALLVFEQRASEVDLVLTDVAMPLMSGDQLVQRLELIRPGLCVVFMSGNLDIGTKDGRDLRGRPFMQKPFRPEELLRVVRRALGRSTIGPVASGVGLTHTEPMIGRDQAAVLPLSQGLGHAPPSLLEQLLDAAVTARPRRIEQLAEELAQYSPAAAIQLRQLAHELRFEDLAAEVRAARQGISS
jgi:DNA-binding response OmpR family regulator